METFSMKMRRFSGVYFLKLNGKIVYIGKSKNVFARVFNDHSRLKQFDELEVHWLPEDELLDYEREQIAKHKPPLNDVGWKIKTAKTRKRFDSFAQSA